MRERLQALRVVFTTTREADPRLLPYMGAAVAAAAVVAAVVAVFLSLAVGIGVGVVLAPLAALAVLGRRAAAVQLEAIEGRPGAAYAVLRSLPGAWQVIPGVAMTRKQDLVHLAVGRPGVVLVGEGSPARVRSLLKQEARRLSRVVGDVPVHQVSVGDGDGQVDLKDVRMHVAKLPRAIKRREVGELTKKLAALGGSKPPIPKGPIPGMHRR